MSFQQASVTEVAAYVRRLQLDGFTFTDYADILESERINGKVFLALTLDGFNSIGIIDYPRRKLFHQHIELLRSQHTGNSAVNMAPKNLTIRFKVEPVHPIRPSQPTESSTSLSTCTPGRSMASSPAQPPQSIVGNTGGATDSYSMSTLPLTEKTQNIPMNQKQNGQNGQNGQNIKHQDFNEAIKRLLSSNTLNLNLPPFPMLPSMSTPFQSVGAVKRPFATDPGSDQLHISKRRKFNELNQAQNHSVNTIDTKMTVNNSLTESTDTKRGRFKVTKSGNKKKGKARHTYRRWTDEENILMRELCGNKEQSRIDWMSIQKEKMPYRTVCGIRQHWENMQRRDKLRKMNVPRDTRLSLDVDESRRSLYESDESSESEGEDGSHYSDTEDGSYDQGTDDDDDLCAEDATPRQMPELTE